MTKLTWLNIFFIYYWEEICTLYNTCILIRKNINLLEDDEMFLCLGRGHFPWSLPSLGRRWNQV